METETNIVHAILDWLHWNKFMVWRNNAGAHFVTKKGKEYMIRMSPKGVPDIIGLSKQGNFIGIEVKKKGNKPTVEQAQFLSYVNDSGGIGLLAYSIDDVQREFKARGLI